MERINEISLAGVLPKVFEGDGARPSDVWLSQLVLRRGTLNVIAAESGAGKSSLCAYLYGTRRDYLGRIEFDGADISTFSISDWQELRRRHLAYLPQEMALFPELTALENIRIKNDLTGAVEESRIREWLSVLGIADRGDFPVGRMSVGQQQRVGVIRSLCQPFDFLLLDEPVSHLDEGNNRIVARIVMEEAARRGAGVVATSVGNHLLLDGASFLNL